MISELRIRQLGVISEATLPFGPGFSVVTGETGAGKTMVVTAVGLLLGARSDAGAVRLGAKSALAEATFELATDSQVLAQAEEAGAEVEAFDDGAELLVSRSVNSDGRSRAFVGGRAAPVGVLAELGNSLVTVHGQSDQIRLKSAAAQREALDAFAGAKALLAQYQQAYQSWQQAERKLADVTSNSAQRAQRVEQLREAVAEINGVDPQPGEDEELKAESVKLSNVETLRLAAGQAHEALQSEEFGEVSDAGTLVDAAKRVLEGAADQDEDLGALAKRLDEVSILIGDVATELGSYLAGLDEDTPARLAAIEDRRGELASLTRKYAPTVDEVLTFADTSRAELDELEGDGGSLEKLQEQVEAAHQAALAQAKKLTAARTKAAATLSKRVSAELSALAMPDAQLHVNVTESALGSHGADEIAFLLQPHQGSAPRPLGKGASGGELSRVMLALEVVLAETDPVPTFVFDEVDAGVGGKAAVEIGRRLAMLAKHVQVLVVTHLPQVAAFADAHIRVLKSSDDGLTSSDVRVLDHDGRRQELARMLAGQEDSATAQAHAEELLVEAGQK